MIKMLSLAPFEEQIRKELDEQVKKFLDTKGLEDASLTFKVDLTSMYKDKPKAILAFSPEAYAKIHALATSTTDEVAAHGTVKRIGIRTFIVEDILVYPQTVTTATVQATDNYVDWMAKLPDETFNKLRFQYHSHGNGSVFASGVDTAYYKTILSDVEDFYIFMVGNRRFDHTFFIYDVENNIYYDKDDVSLTVAFNENYFAGNWLKDNEKYFEKLNKPAIINAAPPVEPTAEKVKPNPRDNRATIVKLDEEKKTGQTKPCQPDKRGAGRVPKIHGLNPDTPPVNGKTSTAADDCQYGTKGVTWNCFYYDYPTVSACNECLSRHGLHPCES